MWTTPHQNYLATLPNFLAYFGAALVLLAIFLAVYLLVTPHREFRLIRAGNAAAAVTLVGAVIGFVLPLGSVIQNSLSLLDVVVWGAVALVVQILTFLGLRLALPELVRQIEADRMAPAITLAGFSIAVGFLNAASMSY